MGLTAASLDGCLRSVTIATIAHPTLRQESPLGNLNVVAIVPSSALQALASH